MLTTTEFIAMTGHQARKALHELPTGELVELYNGMADTPVKKFRDRATGVERLLELRRTNRPSESAVKRVDAAERLNGKVKVTPESKQAIKRLQKDPPSAKEYPSDPVTDREKAVDEQFTAEYEQRKAAEPSEPTVEATPAVAQPVSQAPLQRIRLKSNLNPKKAGSKAFDRFELYVDGMTVAEAKAAGITREDIRWDTVHGHITLE